MADAAHWPQWEKPEEHDQVLIDFIKGDTIGSTRRSRCVPPRGHMRTCAAGRQTDMTLNAVNEAAGADRMDEYRVVGAW